MCRYTGIDTTHARTNDIEKATEIDWKICSFWIKPTFGSKTSFQTRPFRHIFSNRVDKATLGLPETSDRIRRIDSIRVGEGQKSDRYYDICLTFIRMHSGLGILPGKECVLLRWASDGDQRQQSTLDIHIPHNNLYRTLRCFRLSAYNPIFPGKFFPHYYYNE